MRTSSLVWMIALVPSVSLAAGMQPEQVLGEISISATPLGGDYIAPPTAAAAKTDIPLMETPMSVQTVTREAMDDQQVVTVKDAVKSVSGVVSSSYSYYDNFQIRGFATDSTIYVDGLLLESIGGLETALLDGVEVVKGPASMLFGRIEPGGLVNIVSKKPQEQFAASLQQQVGEYGLFRTTADITGKLTEDGKVLYRLTGAYHQADSFMDVVQKENMVGAASFTFKPINEFEFNLRLDAQDYKFVDIEDIGIPIAGNRPVKVSRNTFLGDAVGWDIPNNPKRTLAGFDWTYILNEQWKVTQRFHWDDRDEHQTTLWSNGFDGIDTLDRGLWFVDVDRKTLATNIDLAGDIELAGMRHRLLLGVDWYKHTEDWTGFSGTTPLVPSINIFNPNNHAISASALRGLADNFFFGVENEWYGLYAQDQISITERLELQVGGRYDWAEAGNGESGTSLSDAKALIEPNKDEAFSPRVGLLYKLNRMFSTYASYSESFGQNNGRSATGGSFDPQSAEQYEIGGKYSSEDESLTASISIFNLEKQNVLTDNVTTPDPTDQIAIGEVRNRGLEIDVSGRVTSHVNLVGSYTYNDMEITKDNDGNQGNRPRNVPRHSANLWAKYDNAPGAAEGWQIGAGVNLVDQRFGDNANTWELPGYATVSAMLAYRTKVGNKGLSAQINVDNLFDKEYYDRGGFDAAKYGAPRTVIGSVKLEF